MTNTTQTNLLDGVEPDAFVDGNGELSLDKIRDDDEGMLRISKVSALLASLTKEHEQQIEYMRINLHISNEMLRGEGVYRNQVCINDAALAKPMPKAMKEEK